MLLSDCSARKLTKLIDGKVRIILTKKSFFLTIANERKVLFTNDES